MATNGRDMDYDFGRKRHWRRTVWNEVVRRIDKTSQYNNGVILYLGGINNNDIDDLRMRGVDSCNAICVDRDFSAVKAIRSRGGLCIHGDIRDVLGNWPIQIPIMATCFDLCSGITKEIISWMTVLLPHMPGVVVVNLLRGRDPSVSSYVRAIENAWRKGGSPSSELKSRYKGNPRYFSSENGFRHRGFVLWNLTIDFLEHKHNKIFSDKELNAVWQYTNPWFYSYMSDSGQVFDTIIQGPNDRECSIHWTEKNLGLRRQISAVLAHRTMRMSA